MPGPFAPSLLEGAYGSDTRSITQTWPEGKSRTRRRAALVSYPFPRSFFPMRTFSTSFVPSKISKTFASRQ